MTWERARTEQQKQQRIQEIIDATARLYQERSFEEITFALIAKEAKFTRSNLYKYFNSKEEIFFEFLKYDIVTWRKDFVSSVCDKAFSVEEFAEMWFEVQQRHLRMQDLISILYAHLEKKSSLETLVSFKKMVVSEFGILCGVLQSIFPKLSVANAIKFLQIQLALSIGLYTMTDLSPTQEKVFEITEFAHLKMGYPQYFKQSLVYMLRGLINDSKV
ncbi:TetR family transcriptional regulator [Candidatus Uabimicrobium amorphum]|uniref:TetR family transcriptional regulator n=1 Tax=Uabimicrobium amorphum TaxID=2596890 RepID=A0A5S9F268_UABAM|nr:TetR family transcriptional regulator [Candidatus Uabimicrobium amorphum]BBM81792.1 TetR family transcriptional regulator [Candidatus Uabimicrobium amorphum]